MPIDGRNGARGITTLLRDLAEGSVTLARDEIRLAKLELAAAVRGIGTGTALTAAGATLAALGALSLLVGLVLLAGDQWLPADRYWLAALVLLVITGIAAAWFAKRGLNLLSAHELAPTETAQTLKEDTAWLKRQLTSGATSS